MLQVPVHVPYVKCISISTAACMWLGLGATIVADPLRTSTRLLPHHFSGCTKLLLLLLLSSSTGKPQRNTCIAQWKYQEYLMPLVRQYALPNAVRSDGCSANHPYVTASSIMTKRDPGVCAMYRGKKG